VVNWISSNGKVQISIECQSSNFKNFNSCVLYFLTFGLRIGFDIWILKSHIYLHFKKEKTCLSMNIDVGSVGRLLRGLWRWMREATHWCAPIVEKRSLRKFFLVSLHRKDRIHLLPVALGVDRQDLVEGNGYRWSAGFKNSGESWKRG
jgi:hypothetical protein